MGDGAGFGCLNSLPLALGEFAAGTGCESISNPPELAQWVNDKRNLLAALRQLGLPTIPGQWWQAFESRYTELSAAMGLILVAHSQWNFRVGNSLHSIRCHYDPAGERVR